MSKNQNVSGNGELWLITIAAQYANIYNLKTLFQNIGLHQISNLQSYRLTRPLSNH